MHVAALAILDAEALLDGEGLFRLEALRDEVERRLHLAPRLRQVVYRPPFGFGPPLWVDDNGFDVARHVRSRAVPPPGDEAAMLEVCEALNEPPLRRSLPLWEMWFLTGLHGGKVGMLIRLHHVIADGIAALALLGSLFDSIPNPPRSNTPAWIPASPPNLWALLADNARRRVGALTSVLARVARPTDSMRRLWTSVRGLVEYAGDGLAPRSSLNAPVGRARRLLLARTDLDAVKGVAHAHGARVNDVVLAAVAGGARELLRSRGELAPGSAVRAMVPVSLRGPGDSQGPGNRVGVTIVPLPIGEPDPVRRLEEITRATAERKKRPLRQWARVPALLTGLMTHQRFVNLFTSNVPGPPTPMFFAGAPVLEVFQVGVIQGNVTLGVGVLSYAGQLNFDIVADAKACPDVAVFAKGLTDGLEQLGVATRSAAVRRRRSSPGRAGSSRTSIGTSWSGRSSRRSPR